jgi:transposase
MSAAEPEPVANGGPTAAVPLTEECGDADANLSGLAACARRGRGRRQRGRRLVQPDHKAATISAQQRLLLLDCWQRGGLPAGDFAALVGVSKHTLYAWKKRFDTEGPGGLVERPRGGPKSSRLPELTKRTILLMKQSNPDWGCQRISDLLARGPALPASPGAVARVLHEAGHLTAVTQALSKLRLRQHAELGQPSRGARERLYCRDHPWSRVDKETPNAHSQNRESPHSSADG